MIWVKEAYDPSKLDTSLQEQEQMLVTNFGFILFVVKVWKHFKFWEIESRTCKIIIFAFLRTALLLAAVAEAVSAAGGRS